jgi:7-carboxy-7-deazaguanine synthase
LRICEIFQSLQGEGRLTGTPSVFVRSGGCNLRCWYCDTPYASWQPEGEDLSVEEIVARVEPFPAGHVVLTGGEPMLFAELVPLTAALARLGRHVTIETAGTLYLPVTCDLMSISPKLANSTPPAERDPRWSRRHEQSRRAPEVIRRLIAEYDYQLKFVVDRPADCDEIERYLAASNTHWPSAPAVRSTGSVARGERECSESRVGRANHDSDAASAGKERRFAREGTSATDRFASPTSQPQRFWWGFGRQSKMIPAESASCRPPIHRRPRPTLLLAQRRQQRRRHGGADGGQ